MLKSRILLAAAAALLAGSIAFAADAPAGGGGMMRGMFTKEERMMMMADAFKATSGMSEDQRHAYRQAQRQRIMAMSDADRAKFKSDLDTRWAALPPDQKAAIQAKLEALRAAHQQAGDQGGQGGQ